MVGMAGSSPFDLGEGVEVARISVVGKGNVRDAEAREVFGMGEGMAEFVYRMAPTERI